MDRLERLGDMDEYEKIKKTAEEAHIFKKELQRLIDIDFKNPNNELIEFARKNNLDLNDTNVQNNFLKIRDEYIERVNVFYRSNIIEPNTKKKKKQKECLENKPEQDKTNSSQPQAKPYTTSKKSKSTDIVKDKETYNLSPIIYIFPAFIILYYITFYLS